MSKYLKSNKNTASSPALKRAQRNIYWQAGLAITTIVLTIVIVFAMTAAWYTNIVQTSGLVFEAEAWGFDGEIVVNSEAIQAAPGDEGLVHLEVSNASESISAVSVSASKTGMINAVDGSQMQKRLYFYVDTQMVRNEETMERIYLNSLDSYTYTLFGNGKLTLTEETHSDAPLKWQWVYDMLGYYVLGAPAGNSFREDEYLRPVEYNYDAATFEYVTDATGRTTIELTTVDGETTVRQFLEELSKTDGYKDPIDYAHPVAKGYYPVEVDEDGYGVYVYLCSYVEIQEATQFDTKLGQLAAGDQAAMPSYPVSLTVSAQKNDENVVSVATLAGLNTAMELMPGTIVQLTEDITLTAEENLVIPAGSQIILDLNGKNITSTSAGNAIDAKPGSVITFINSSTTENGGAIIGSGKGTGIFAAGAEVTLNNVDMSGFVDCIFVKDNEKDNTMDSKIRLVDCEFNGLDCAVYLSGNGSVTEQTTQLVVEGCTLRSGNVVIYGNGDTAGTGRWGTDIQIIDSVIEADPAKVSTGIYHPQKDSTLTIYNSTVSGATGIGIKGGTISIKASTIRGTGPELGRNPKPSNSGCDDTGDGIYIEANYGYEIRLTISGAMIRNKNGELVYTTSVIDSTNNQSLRVWEPDAANVSVKISGGKFKQEQPQRYLAEGALQLKDEADLGLGYTVEIPTADE